jgi:hypothetical protein
MSTFQLRARYQTSRLKLHRTTEAIGSFDLSLAVFRKTLVLYGVPILDIAFATSSTFGVYEWDKVGETG